MPTDDDWKELEIALGMSQAEADTYISRGSPVGSKLAGNASLWDSGDLKDNAAFGESGFSALPGGYRRYIDGAFDNLGINAGFWSVSEYDSRTAWFRYLYYDNSDVHRFINHRQLGFSVRLVKE